MNALAQAQATITANLDWITSRRWYGDKARPVERAIVLYARYVAVDEVTWFLTVTEFSYQWGPSSRYFVPFTLGEESDLAETGDASASPAFLRWFIEGFAEGRDLGDDVHWRWRTIGDEFPDTATVDFEHARPVSAEQSNTTVLFGDAFIGKIFRKVPPGLNPDLEIGEFLAAGEGFEHVPELFGVIEIVDNAELTAIAAVQEFVPNVGDGWNWLLRSLEGADDAKRQQLVADVGLLGRRTAEMHIALAQDDGNDAFRPVEIDHDAAEAIVQRVIAEMDASVEGLTKFVAPEDLAHMHGQLGDMMGSAWTMVGTLLTRVHGDYHLGQTLRTPDDDFMIIDFEGEPSRSMDERRQKLPPIKDVAGMVRSLDYAGATLMQADVDAATRRALEAWVEEATDAFVHAWRTTVLEQAPSLAPEDQATFDAVLNLFVAEKALYETRYELNNRPDWLWIPLNALKRLAGMEVD